MTDRALYLYAVARAEDGDALPGGPGGIDPRGALELVAADGLVALCSAIVPGELERIAGEAQDGDLTGLEAAARAHAGVLERAGGARSLLPLRFGTVVADRAAAVRLLRERHGELERTLERLEGTCEWGVKALLARERLEAELAADEPALAELRELGGGDGGGAFFARRRLERELADRVASRVPALAAELHERLAGCARAATANPPQPRELSGYADEMILNGAYLVERGGEERLRAAVGELSRAYAELGVSLELTGPWPAYNFVDAPEPSVA